MSNSLPAGIRLPPGPRWPRFLQSVAYLTVGRRLIDAMSRRFGTAFLMKLPFLGPTVFISDPALARELFQQPIDAIRGVEANLGQVLGPGSMFGLEGEAHRRHRKLLLPPFHGKSMRTYADVIEHETLKEISDWPEGREFAVLPTTLNVTLNTILRATFGAEGEEFDRLRLLIPRITKLGQLVAFLPWLRRDLGPWGPWGRFQAMRAELDSVTASLTKKAMADPGLDRRTDILSVLLRARCEDGTVMSPSDIADELFTMVVAGHETVATSLCWAIERLRRHPDVLARLVDEIDAGESALLQATTYEVLRTRPVIAGTAREVVAPSISLGEWVIPRGYTVAVSTDLTHLNEHVYHDAAAFNPDRFVGVSPDLYSWIPFGGGTRRCLGAAFAAMEMQLVLRTILKEFHLVPTDAPAERWRNKGVTVGPARGGRAVVYRRRKPPQRKASTQSAALSE